MSSTSKTTNLRLNLWSGSDKPKRVDFNSDNEILESVISGHLSDASVHFTEDEKDAVVTPFVVGAYTGNGANVRAVTLSFKPKFIIIYANLVPFSSYSDGKMLSYAGIATEMYSSPGITLTDTGMTLLQSTSTPVYDNFYPCMNQTNFRYQYIAFK